MRCWFAALSAVIVVACGSTPSAPRYSPGEPTAEQQAFWKQLIRLYDEDEDGPEFAAARDEAAKDPVVAYHLTQLLVSRWFFSLQSRADSADAQFLKSVVGERDPDEVRSRRHLVAMGPEAVMPLVREELLKPTQGGERRVVGYELIEALGPATLPWLEELLESDEPRLRRIGIKAVGAAGAAEAAAEYVDRALRDEDFTVRAAAVEVLGSQPGTDEVLRRVLFDDEDSFVRRMAARQLGDRPSRKNAEHLVAYLEACLISEDRRGVEAAQEALQAVAGRRGLRSVEAWRLWLGSYADPVGRDGNER